MLHSVYNLKSTVVRNFEENTQTMDEHKSLLHNQAQGPTEALKCSGIDGSEHSRRYTSEYCVKKQL